MAQVSEVVLKYAARGANKVERADRNVRESIKETAKTARQESGTVRRWMQRHRSALLGIGAAATGVLAAIIQASPALSAELAQIRFGLSLLAMTIGQDVQPTIKPLTDTILELADAYENLPDPVRTIISHLIFFGAVLGIVAAGAAALETIISGTLVASLGGKLVSAIWGVVSGSLAFAALIGSIIGMIGVWILKITGVLGIIRQLGKWLGDILPGWVRDAIITIIGLFAGPLAAIGGFIIGFVEGGFDKGVEKAKEVIMTFVEAAARLFSPVVDTVEGIFDTLVDIGEGVFETVVNFLGDPLGYIEDVLDNLQRVAAQTWDTVVDIALEIMPDVGVEGRNNRISPDLETGVIDPRKVPILSDAYNLGASFAKGGVVGEGGMATVHSRETILPPGSTIEVPSGAMPGGGSSVVFKAGAIQIDGTGDTERDVERMIEEVISRLGGGFSSRSKV